MDEIQEKREVVHDYSTAGQPVVERRYDHVVREPRGLSGGAIAAIVISAVIAAALITWLIVSNQQQNRDQELAVERERAAAAQAQAQQPQQQSQPPNVVVMPQPQSQPSTIPVPVPVPVPTQPAPETSSAAPSNTGIEINVNQKFLDDKQLSSYTIDAKADNGVVTLSGELPSNDLKMRAEKLAGTVKGVRRVVNNITVRSE